MSSTAIVGAVLIAPVAALAVETAGFRGGPFDQAFWRISLDRKLDRIAARRRAWSLINVPWLATVTLLTAGLAGLAYLIGDVTAWIGLGAFTIAATAWLVCVAMQDGAIAVAAARRAETGATPDWTAAIWAACGVLELVWIIVGNLAGAAFAIAVSRTDLLPHWLGWTAAAVSLASALVVAIARDGFPHLVLPVPFALGIAILFV